MLRSADRSPSRDSAAPLATMVSGFRGTIICSPENPRRSAKTLTNVELNVSGPPSKMTGGLMSRPCAKPPIVCLAMAWNVDSAISDLLAP